MKGVSLIGIVSLAFACAVSALAEVQTPAVRTPETLRTEKKNSPAEQPALLRQILGLIDQNRIDEASTLFETARKMDKASPPMLEYLHARLAIARESYTEALQHLAQISVFYSRDPEWAPAAVFFEGLVYKRTGQAEAARQAAGDLLLGWPESEWSPAVWMN